MSNPHAIEVVARLWQDPPPDAADLRRRLKGPLSGELRLALLDALVSGTVPAARWKVAADALRVLGVEPIRDRLIALAADGGRAPHVRAASATAALAEGGIPAEVDRDRVVEAALIAAFFLDDHDLPAIARAVAEAGGRERVEHWRRLMGFTSERVWGRGADDVTPLPTRAILSSPRGDGSFTVVYQADGPGGTITTAIVAVGAGKSRVEPLLPRAEAERLLESLPGTFCALPAGVAAAIAPPPAPFDTIVTEAPPVPVPEPVDLPAARALLAGPLCDDWAFTATDVEVAGIAFIPPDLRDEDWYEVAAGALATARGTRVAALASAMARFCALAGHPGANGFAGLAAATEADFSSSPLVRILLERAVEVPPDEVLEFGDKAHRDAIRARHRIERATGRDLARLDLVEAAAIGLVATARGIPAWRRPSRTAIDAAAERLGERFLAGFLADGRLEHAGIDAIPELVAELGPDADRFARGARDQLRELVTTVCGACRVRCWMHAEADVDAAYRSPLHPILQP